MRIEIRVKDLCGAGEQFPKLYAEGTVLWRGLEGVVGCDGVPVCVGEVVLGGHGDRVSCAYRLRG